MPTERREVGIWLPLYLSRGHPRGLIRVNRHAARVAAACIYVAKGIEIWIRRREQLLIEDELTSVGISGRAGPLAAARAAVVVDTIDLETGARARRGAIRRWRRRRRQRQTAAYYGSPHRVVGTSG